MGCVNCISFKMTRGWKYARCDEGQKKISALKPQEYGVTYCPKCEKVVDFNRKSKTLNCPTCHRELRNGDRLFLWVVGGETNKKRTLLDRAKHMKILNGECDLFESMKETNENIPDKKDSPLQEIQLLRKIKSGRRF